MNDNEVLRGVAQVSKVVGLGAAFQLGFLGFDEVAHVDFFRKIAARPDVGVGTELHARAYARSFNHACRLDPHAVADLGIADDGIRLHAAVSAQARPPQQLHVGTSKSSRVSAIAAGGRSSRSFRNTWKEGQQISKFTYIKNLNHIWLRYAMTSLH